MKRIIISFVGFSMMSCVSAVNNEPENSNIVKNIEPSSTVDEYKIIDSSSDESDNLVTEETIKDYNLTVLKGQYYPEIKNDTPFTETELKILQSSNDFIYEADVQVAHYFKYFLRDKRDLLEKWVDNARPYIPEIKKEFIKQELPEELIFLPFLESGYNVKAYSKAGAGGIWQFMPKTANSYGLRVNWWKDERRNPFLATPYAIKHLKYLNNLFDDWYLTLAAYNAGQGRIKNALKKSNTNTFFELADTTSIPFETRRYIPQYIAISKIMSNLEELGFEPIDYDHTPDLLKIKIPSGTDLYNLSGSMSLNWSTFLRYNPQFRRKINDPTNYSYAYIPADLELIALNYINNSKPVLKGNGYSYYTIKSGDSWWYLAQITNRSISDLKKINNISTNSLRIGQKIMLPGYNEPIRSITQQATYTPNSNLRTYTVKSGDTISSISIRYNIKLNSLYLENGLNSRSILKIGQIIRLPGYPANSTNSTLKNASEHKKIEPQNNYYTVKYGDSVWLIAQKTKVPYQKLLTLNNLNSNSKLKIGEKLLLY